MADYDAMTPEERQAEFNKLLASGQQVPPDLALHITGQNVEPRPGPGVPQEGVDVSPAGTRKIMDAFNAPPPVVDQPEWLAKQGEILPADPLAEAARRAASGVRGAQAANPPAQPMKPRGPLGSVRGTLRQQGPDMSALGGTFGGGGNTPGTPSTSRPPVQLVPTPPSGNPKPVINLPKGTGQIPATATLFLFIGLAAVTLWRPVFKPLLIRAGSGSTQAISAPSGAVFSLLLFGILLVFISELGPEAAQFTALLMFALWAVFLVMNPSVVTTFAGWVSQGSQGVATASQSQSKQASNKGA